VLYVGKARSLRSRVRSYFQPSSSDTRFFVERLPREIGDLETFVVENEKEAALLENALIKEHKPRYNFKLRDDKDYLSLRLEQRPRAPLARQGPAPPHRARDARPSPAAGRARLRSLTSRAPPGAAPRHLARDARPRRERFRARTARPRPAGARRVRRGSGYATLNEDRRAPRAAWSGGRCGLPDSFVLATPGGCYSETAQLGSLTANSSMMDSSPRISCMVPTPYSTKSAQVLARVSSRWCSGVAPLSSNIRSS
jgi:hypothetical protein